MACHFNAELPGGNRREDGVYISVETHLALSLRVEATSGAANGDRFIAGALCDDKHVIVDVETGEEELPQGEIGEIIMQGPQVMKGYWRAPTETANVLREHPSIGPGLWLHSGDIGLMDEEGYFQIVDRKKDMIICSGFNVYPRDIEDVLYKHPAVQLAGVVGIPDDYRGETAKAFVVLKEGMTATEEEIITFCRDHLAKYKVPTSVEFRSELPLSALGKVLRRDLVD